MPIRPPALDDRSYQDLVAEMVRRIPAHTPEWTSPQEGDPGRTIIDLMAWLADTILYRANLIPERQRLAFLKLVGGGLRPARPAQGLISLSLAKPTDVVEVACPKSTALLKPVHFETKQDVTVLPLTARCYFKRKPSREEEKRFQSLLPDLMELYQAGGATAAPYVSTNVFPDGAAELAGRDIIRETVDGCLWIGLAAHSPEQVTDVRSLMAQSKYLNIGLAPAVAPAAALDGVGERQPIPLIWDIHSMDDQKRAQFNRLSVISDSTHGLTAEGIVRLQLPALSERHAPTMEILRAGLGEHPPRLDDAVAASSIVAWIRLRPETSARLQSLPLSWVGINAVAIEQLETIGGRRTIGQGNGASDQMFNLGVGSVDLSTLQIDVTDDLGQPRPWRRVDDTASAGADDAVFSVDSESGDVRFGDGVRGRAPQIGSLVQVFGLRGGGGAVGNLPAGTLKDIALSDLKVTQPLATHGGADAETLDQAERRIPQSLRNQERAVSEQDFRNLAIQTPGLTLGRVEVLPRFKPHQRRSGIPGVVSVMCLPRVEGFDGPAPRPDRPTLETVHGWLDPRRPLATELYVIGCEYVPLGVSVAVELIDPDRRQSVLAGVKEALKQWLWALPPGGPTGQGWPLGRRVVDRELEVVVARVDGVDGVAPILIYTKDTSSARWKNIGPGAEGRIQLDLKPWQLPELLDVVVIEGQIADASALGAQSPAGAGETIAIPVVPEVC